MKTIAYSHQTLTPIKTICFLIFAVMTVLFFFNCSPPGGGGGGGGDTTPPTLSGTFPVTGALDVDNNTATTLTLTFSENVVIGSGNIYIHKVGEAFYDTITPTSLAGDGTSTIVATLNKTLLGTADYYVHIDGTLFADAATNAYAGIADTVTWTFSTVADAAGPVLVSTIPADNAADVASSLPSLRLTFNEDVVVNATPATNLIIFDNSDTAIATILPGNITANGKIVTAVFPETLAPLPTWYYVNYAADQFRDPANNDTTAISGNSTWNFSVVTDAQAPQLQSTVPSNNALDVSQTTSELTMTFDEPVSINSAAGDVTIYLADDDSLHMTILGTNVTASDTTVTIPLGTGTNFAGGEAYYIHIPSGLIQDKIPYDYTGINDDSTWRFTVVIDTTSPTVTINQAAGQGDPSNEATIDFTVVFSEPVADFDETDVTIGGTAAYSTQVIAVTGSGTTYNVAVSGMNADGTITAGIAAGAAHDAAPNPSEASTSTDNSVTYDATAPTPVITQTVGQNDPVTAGPISFTVAFGETVSGFDQADIDLSASTAGGTLSAGVSPAGDAQTFTVTVTGMTGGGNVIISFNANAAVDLAGNNSNTPTLTDNQVTWDDQAGPSVAVTSTTQTRTGANPIPVTITFSEAVTGFLVTEINVTNGSAGNLAGGPTVYTADITPTAAGAVSVDVDAGAAQDLVGNNNSASSALDRTYILSPGMGTVYTGITNTIDLTISSVASGSNNNRLLLVLITAHKITNGSPGINAPIWNGTSMTQFGTVVEFAVNGNRHAVWVYYISNPTANITSDITVHWGGQPIDNARGVAIPLYDVDLTDPFGNAASSTTPVADWTITVNAESARSFIFDMISAHTGNLTTLTPNAAQTILFSTLTFNASGFSYRTATTSGNIDMNWTMTPAPTGGAFRAIEVEVAQ